jgi:integrase
VSAILGAAVEDGMLAKNPARLKAVGAPLAAAADPAVVYRAGRAGDSRAPPRYQAAPVVAAGCGLRQGEVFGLAVEDVDFLGRWVLVRQQVKLLRGKPGARSAEGREDPRGAAT